jgi:hypothetical protein
MSRPAPYAVDAWYPAVRAPAQAFRVLGEGDAPGAGEVDAAWAALAPGEALVLVCRPRGPSRRLARLGRRGFSTQPATRFAGADRIDRWLVLPGTGGSHVLLPAAREGFLAGLRLLPAGRWSWRAARRILAFGSHLGLASRLGFDELLVAVKGPAGPPLVPWMAATGGSDVTVALGVPGLLRKAVVLVSGAAGDVRGLLKLSLTGAAREQVRREAEALRRLSGLASTRVFAPALLDHGRAGGLAWLVQGFLEGRRSPDALGAAHFSFLAELHSRTAEESLLVGLEVFRAARARLDALRDAVDPEWHETMSALRDALLRHAAGERIPCSTCHGDFAPWNLLVSRDRIVAFDWEFCQERVPALFDLLHFHIQTGILVRHVGARRLLEELDALAAGPARGLLRELALDPHRIDGLAGLYVLHVATSDEEVNLIERPPFPQVEWLKRSRTELARLLEARLREKARRSVGRRMRAA